MGAQRATTPRKMVLVLASGVWFTPRRVRSQEKRRLGRQGHYLMDNKVFQ